MQAPFTDWFARRGWTIHPHQSDMLARAAAPALLLIAPTGGGKTLAGFLPTLAELTEAPRPGLHTLYVSPLKALAADIRRNLMTPITEMALPIRVEDRTGDTSATAKRRQRADPPHILLTTPESLALLLSYEDAPRTFAGLERVIVDEIHALSESKRGDQLMLALARLQTLRPGLRRVGLSATVDDPAQIARLLARHPDPCEILHADPGPDPDIRMMTTEARPPWSGGGGRYAIPDVLAEVKRHRTTLIFHNTRAQAELFFHDLWLANEDALPIGIHHGSLSREQRERVEAAMVAGALRAIVCTGSLDLGIDWGDVDLVIQVGAPKNVKRLVQRIGRANHRYNAPSKALLVPANRFEVVECVAALDAAKAHDLDGDPRGRGPRDVLCQQILIAACAGPSTPAPPHRNHHRRRLCRPHAPRVRRLPRLRRHRRLRAPRLRPLAKAQAPPGRAVGAARPPRRPPDPHEHRHDPGHRHAQGPLPRPGRRAPGRDRGRLRRLPHPRRHLPHRRPRRPLRGPARDDGRGHRPPRPATEDRHLQRHQVRHLHPALRPHPAHVRAGQLARPPAHTAEWLALQREVSRLPSPDRLLVETFPHEGREHLCAYGFAGRNAMQTLGLLLTRQMEDAGLAPVGFVSTDYAVLIWGLDRIPDPAPFFEAAKAPRRLRHLARRQRGDEAHLPRHGHHRGPHRPQLRRGRKSGRQATMSSDILYDTLMKYDPGHLLLDITREEAMRGLVDFGRIEEMLARTGGRIDHVRSPASPPSPHPSSSRRAASPWRARRATACWPRPPGRSWRRRASPPTDLVRPGR
jgi:ATP-dependent helicase Lhr and Lhr-like helicase